MCCADGWGAAALVANLAGLHHLEAPGSVALSSAGAGRLSALTALTAVDLSRVRRTPRDELPCHVMQDTVRLLSLAMQPAASNCIWA